MVKVLLFLHHFILLCIVFFNVHFSLLDYSVLNTNNAYYTYSPTGSGSGRTALLNDEVDWCGTDLPFSDAELADVLVCGCIDGRMCILGSLRRFLVRCRRILICRLLILM